MEQESAEELIYRQTHDAFLVAVGGVSPSEDDVATCERDQSPVGDGDTVSVGAKITQNVFRTSERWFGIHHPVLTEQHS